jgi:tripartite-type tricarboxylate transporter receptor subunit TctC
MKRATQLCLAASVLTVLGAQGAAALAAEAWPARPIRVIVPFPPGGSNDIVARMVGAQLTERLGKTVVVDNRGGAAGTIGTEIAVRSQPDGHTLLIISAAYAYNPMVYKLPYDPVKAISPVTLLGTGPTSLVVSPALPVGSVKELVALAKAKPGEMYYASAGVGSFTHLSCELFRIMAGINVAHVPFKGGGPAMLEVMSGRTQYTMGTIVQAMPHIRSGRLKVLGIGSTRRLATLPDTPTIAESGVPGYEAANWWGIIAPAGTPPAVVKRLHAETATILKLPEIQKWFVTEGAEGADMTTAQFAKFILSEMAKWGKVVKQAGIKADY